MLFAVFSVIFGIFVALGSSDKPQEIYAPEEIYQKSDAERNWGFVWNYLDPLNKKKYYELLFAKDDDDDYLSISCFVKDGLKIQFFVSRWLSRQFDSGLIKIENHAFVGDILNNGVVIDYKLSKLLNYKAPYVVSLKFSDEVFEQIKYSKTLEFMQTNRDVILSRKFYLDGSGFSSPRFQDGSIDRGKSEIEKFQLYCKSLI